MGRVKKCARCHKRDRVEGGSYCNHCLGLYRKARVKKRDAEGLCRLCGKRPRVKYRKHCIECLMRARAIYARRKARRAAFEELQREIQDNAELFKKMKEGRL